MVTRMWTKSQTQSTIKDLRKAGYTVENRGGRYKIIDPETGDVAKKNGKSLFTALVGTRGYLVIYHPDLLTEKQNGL